MNIPIVSQLVQLIGGSVTDFLTIRRIKTKGRINLERARQDAELKRVTSMEDYDTLAVQGMEHSWKDEFLVLVFTFILVANFLPGVQDYVIIGWGYLEKAPGVVHLFLHGHGCRVLWDSMAHAAQVIRQWVPDCGAVDRKSVV